MDQTHDLSGQQLYRLAQRFELPDFVKQADVAALCGTQDLPVDCFADPVRRLYPCHTPAATWTSTAFFLDKRADHKSHDAQAIEERLGYYARYHGIPWAIKTLQEKAATVPAEPILPDEDYALIYQQNGQQVRRCPLRNTAEVKAAADYLQKYRDQLPYKLRRDFADKVLNKAAEHAANISEHLDYLERQAGYGACTAKTATAFLRDRVRASRKGPGDLSELQQELLKLAQLFEDKPSQLRVSGRLVKLAEVVDSFDRAMGLYPDYGKQLARPEEVLFELTQAKMASAVKDHCATTTGNIYKLADVEKLRLNDVRVYLGDDFADAVRHGNNIDSEKAAMIIPTLDRELAGLFDQLMARADIQPIAKEAGASVGLARDYLLQLAADYRKQRR